MACYKPLTGYRGHYLPSGKQKIVFDEELVEGPRIPITIPCGRCIGCRLERSRQWAIRCVHEAQMNSENSFITLTYDQENLPATGSLVKRDFQLFMKRLRKSLGGKKIKYYHCGEYGEKTHRPHYHACIFGWDPDDKVLWSVRENVRLYTSALLREVWGKGHVTVGEVTFESAAYVARYIMKKILGEDVNGKYERVVEETGEIINVEREYTTMSNGIGERWYKKYHPETYPSDFVVIRGAKMRPPRYYDRRLEADNPRLYESIKEAREEKAYLFEHENTEERLKVKEKVAKARLKKLPRTLE